MSRSISIGLFVVQFLCMAGSMICVIRMWRIAKKTAGRPRLRRSTQTGTRYRVYNALFWAGFSVCNLMLPKAQLPLFWGFFTLFCLAMAAFSLESARFGRYMRHKYFSPDDQSAIRLGS